MTSHIHPTICLAPGAPLVLGKLWATHLGDTLCTSTLPRLLRSQYDGPIFVHDLPMLRAVFSNNPHVAGFRQKPTIKLDHQVLGCGHISQRIQQTMGLPVQPIPKPEIYLDESEVKWAVREKNNWPRERSVCVLSNGGITDRCNLERVCWPRVLRILSDHFTVIQPVVSEPPIPGTIAYHGLTARQYMALVNAADFFVGGTSGGSHVAAAFDTPTLIVTWRAILDHLRFPVSGLGVHAAFLYPQHWFIAAEDITRHSFRENHLRFLIGEMRRCGRAGRPVDISNHPLSPCGFTPAAPRSASLVRNRLMRLPARRPQQTTLSAAAF